MAHFAEIDENNVVLRVVVLDNEHEAIGEEYCHSLFGGRWKQTSYSGSFRKRFAAPGLVYNAERDMFVEPKQKEWDQLNESGDWETPLGINPNTGEPLTDWQWDWLDKVFAIDVHWGGNIG